MKRREVAAFDFDGTLTKKDTFIAFISFVYGRKRLVCGLLIYLPILILMKLRLYPNWKAKQKVFAYFFRGMSYVTFSSLGKSFSAEISKFSNKETIDLLKRKTSEGVITYVITASVDEWVRPFCSSIGVERVIATQIEVDENGKLTGGFSTNNCYGEEKVNRLRQYEPDRKNYHLFACGDSRGDKQLLDFADDSLYLGNDKLGEFIRFGLVGTLCTGIDAAVFYLTSMFVGYQSSLIAGYFVSLIVNYFLTIKWTFRKHESIGNAIGVLLAHLFNLFVVRMGLMYVFMNTLSLSSNFAYIPVLAISVITNFIIVRFVVFHIS